MNHYRIAGWILETEYEFPEITPSPEAPTADLSYQLAETQIGARAPAEGSVHWYHHWEAPGGRRWLSAGRSGGDYLLRFAGIADFQISGDGRAVRCYPLAEVPDATLRHLFLDQVFPLVLSHRGRLVLHASAVAIDGGAAGLLGETGAGKSTLAASLARHGYPLLSDDALLLERASQADAVYFAVPGYPGRRLWGDSVQGLELGLKDAELPAVAHYTEKKRVGLADGLAAFAQNAVALERLVLLNPHQDAGAGGKIKLERVGAKQALLELVASAYCLDLTDRESVRERFDRLAGIADTIPLYRLSYVQDFTQLADIREAVLRLAE